MKKIILPLSMLAIFSQTFASAFSNSEDITDNRNKLSEIVITTAGAKNPVAVNDLWVYDDIIRSVIIPVLENDSKGQAANPDLDPFSVRLIDPLTGARVTSVTKTGYGTLTVLSDGQVKFEPESYVKPVTFEYVVSNLNGEQSNVATIEINIISSPTSPVASNDVYHYGDVFFPVSIPILDNDFPGIWSDILDPTSVRLIDPITGALVTSVIKPGYGQLTVLPDGQVRFEPQFFEGTGVTFEYVVFDLIGSQSNVATLMIDVLGLPMTDPIAFNDVYHYSGVYYPVSIPILNNDQPGDWSSDLDPTSVRLVDPTTGTLVTSVTKPGYGTLTVLLDGQVRFEPQFTTGITVTFDYVVFDLGGTRTNVARLMIDAPLPVTLVSFNVSCEGKTSSLIWSTTQETNSDLFLIQRSQDGKNWKSIGSVKATGESQIIRDYAFTDPAPQGGENLYRLKMIDLDESFSLSGIRSVFHKDMPRLIVYPNPSSDKLLIESFLDGKRIDLYNISGVKVYENQKVSKNVVDVSRFSPGIYTLFVTNSDGTTSAIKVAIVR